MRRLRFRKFVEDTDIFGFEPEKNQENPDDSMYERPINQFDIDLMMEYLSKKSMPAGLKPHTNFISEMQWGTEPGAVKLEIDTGLTFYIKRFNHDLQGSPRWVTKRMFQLNRHGYGGLEDAVAQEAFNHLEKYYRKEMDAPQKNYDELENLVLHISNKLKRTSKDFFMYEGIKKLTDNNYIIAFGVGGHGVETQDHQRVEQNHTQITYDESAGTIRVTNFNIESPVGRAHKWALMPVDVDLYFFPTQDREEISECLAVHMKYY